MLYSPGEIEINFNLFFHVLNYFIGSWGPRLRVKRGPMKSALSSVCSWARQSVHRLVGFSWLAGRLVGQVKKWMEVDFLEKISFLEKSPKILQKWGFLEFAKSLVRWGVLFWHYMMHRNYLNDSVKTARLGKSWFLSYKQKCSQLIIWQHFFNLNIWKTIGGVNTVKFIFLHLVRYPWRYSFMRQFLLGLVRHA